MTESERRDTANVAKSLQASMEKLGGRIDRLDSYGHRNRRYIWTLAIALVFDVLLVVALGLVAVQAREATSLSNTNRQNLLVICLTGNETRKIQADLWNYIIQESAASPEQQTPERQAKLSQFKGYIDKAFAPRDCSIYRS